ncbi:MAG: hypothetical protein FJ290_10010, partial [Planctomycetes bacterium]|nr:hypothetical protein [Planctomycetota bacterium]
MSPASRTRVGAALVALGLTFILAATPAHAAPILEAVVGTPGPLGGGSMTQPAPGLYDITGDGRDIWDADDGFYFVYQTFSATQPLDIWANVGLTGFIGGTNAWRKGGVMVRQSLVNNSRNSCTIIAEADANGINAQIRRNDGAGSEGSTTTGPRITRDTPAYLRVEYLGDGITFRNYYKFNVGDPWTLLGTNLLTTPLTGTILGGLCVTSHDVNQLTTVRFGDVNGFILLEPSAGTLQWNPGAGSANWGTSNWLAVAPGPPPPPPDFPDGTITALLDSPNTVTVEADRLAHTLNISNSGVVAIGAGNTLLVRGPVNASPGGTISLGSNATFSTGPDSDGGTIETLTTSALGGTATVNLARGLLTARRLTMGAGDTLVKAGAGNLTLDQSAGANSMDGTNTLRVNAGRLNMVCGPGPLNGADFILDGGTMELKGVQTVLNTNALQHRGYHVTQDTVAFNIHNNAGMLYKDGKVAVVPRGIVPFTLGPGSRGLDFGADGDFTGTGAVSYTDNYMNLFTGYLNVTAPGAFTFRVSRDDDWSAVWLDLNQDGVFQSNTGTMVTNNGELLAWEDGGTKTVSLAAGKYKFAVGHSEGGGGSTITVYAKSPTMAAEAIIKPADAAQNGLWSIEDVGPINSPTTNISVTANSGLRTVTDYTATLGSLTMDAATTLTTYGGNTVFQGGLSVNGGSAGRTITMAVNNSNLTLDSYTDGGTATNLLKSGLGVLTLRNVTADPASSFRVNAGKLTALSSSPPLGNAQTLVLAGGTFEAQGAPTTVANALVHMGYDFGPDSAMNLHNNGGLMTLTPSSRTLMNRNVVSLFSDHDFIGTGTITRWDNYMNLWIGYLNVTTTGNYQFKVEGHDERSMIWLDLNRNGVFESTTGLLATNNGELLAWQDTGTKTVTLSTAGQYMFAVGHGEYGGGSNLNLARVALPGGSLMPISPGNPNQANLWSANAMAALDMSSTDVTVVAGTTTNVLRALTDYTATFRDLDLGTSSTLTLGGAKMNFASTDFTPGSTLVVAPSGANLGALRTAGGQSNLASTTNVVLDGYPPQSRATVTSYNDQGIANSIMRIYNCAALELDNNAGTVVAGSTNFRVEANSLLRAAATPPATPALGATGNPRVSLAGGTFALLGQYDGGSVANALG